MNNSKVNVIAINSYTTANKLEPKIFVNNGSEVGEVHSFDDGSVSGNKKLCVSTESTGSYTIKEYDSENTEWVNIRVAIIGDTYYETLQAAIDAAGKSQTVKLVSNTRENVTIAKQLTLDLNGYTLNGGTVKGKPALTVTARGVTVKDSNPAQTGTIMREDTAENSGVSSHYVIDVQGAGLLTFKGGNVKNDSGNLKGKGASLVRIGDDSVAKYPKLNIMGGTFTQNNFVVIKVDRGYLSSLNGGTINSANSYAIENWFRATVKGGTVNGDVASWTYSDGANSTLEITGGTINGNVTSVNYGNAENKKATVSITGGTVNGKLDTLGYDPKTGESNAIDDAEKAAIEVSGGTFTNDPTAYLVEDSSINKENGKYSVAKAYLAKVGDIQYYTMDEAFKAQTDSGGKDIVLLRDYKTAGTFKSGSIKRTVDLNGHTWTCTGTGINDAAFVINYSDATLTVKNGKVISNTLVGLIPSAIGGTITYDNSTLIFENVEMISNGNSGIETNGNNTNDTVTLKNSTLNVPNGYGIYFPSSGALNIENSTINAKTMGVQVCSGSLNISNGSTINVTGDPVEKTENDGAIQDGAAISIVNRPGYKGLANVTITGGTFKSVKGKALKAYTWENKTESEFGKSDVITVSGGTFSNEIPRDYCAAGLTSSKNSDGTYTVKDITYVAEVGGVKYETVNAAIAAANNGDTVTLLADTTEDVLINKSITLDLGGKTLTNTGVGKATISITVNNVTVKNGNVIGGASYYNIEVKKGASATLEGVTATAGNNGSSMVDNWGTLTIKSGTYTGGLDVVKNETGAALSISGGTFTLEKGTSKGFTGVIFNYGKLEISGGTFIQGDKSAPYGQAQVIHTDKSGSSSPSTVITGGTFKNLCTRTTAWTVRVTNAAAGSTKVSGGSFNKKISDGYCANGYIPTKNADGTYGVKKGKYVAEVDGDNYETLEEAYANADDGATITLLADCSSDRINLEDKSITLVLNGYTVTSTAAYGVLFCVKNGKTITIDGTVAGSKVVGTIMITGDTYGHIVINGGTYESALYCPIYVNGAVSNDESTVTITNAVITASNGNSDQDNGVAVYLAGYATSTFTNCTITAPVTGIEIRAGRLDLINCNVTGGSGEITTSANGNGTTVTNVAVAVSQHTTKKAIGLNITGGTYTGTAAVYQTNVQGTGSEGVKVKITDGMFKGLINADTANAVAISGGTFDRAVPDDYCADGFIPKNNGDGTYGVTLKPTVTETKKLTVTIGNGKVSYTINSGLKDIWYESFKNNLYESGTHFTVEATPDENYKFLYWINKEGRILSDNPIYSFYLNDNVTIEAVFYKTTVSTAYVVFKDRWNSVLASGRADADGTISVPAVKAYNGYKFIGWFDEGDNQYTVTDGKIKVSVSCNVLAKYEIDSDKLYTVKVDGEIYGKYKYNDLVKVEAKDRKSEGLYFNGWYVGDMLVCYDNVYYFYISGNIALTAKYSDKAIESKPLVSLIVNERNTVSETEQSLLLTAAWYIDSKYKVTAAGILYTFEDGKDLTIEAADGDDDITRTDSIPKNNNDLLGNNASYRYTLKLNGSNTTKTVYAVAYVTYVDDSGNSVTIYTTVQISAA